MTTLEDGQESRPSITVWSLDECFPPLTRPSALPLFRLFSQLPVSV